MRRGTVRTARRRKSAHERRFFAIAGHDLRSNVTTGCKTKRQREGGFDVRSDVHAELANDNGHGQRSPGRAEAKSAVVVSAHPISDVEIKKDGNS